MSEADAARQLFSSASAKELFERDERSRRGTTHARLLFDRYTDPISHGQRERTDYVHQPRIA